MSKLQHTKFGRYRVVRELGRGAMGVVYQAEDESLQRPVAVKTMLLSDDQEERAEHEARFRQEAKAAAGLNHASVVTIYDMGREGDWLYIAMELLDGVELRTLMQADTLSLADKVDLIAQVASGLAAAHNRGIVHRDVKPSNVMVMPGNRAKIMDFGVARMQTSEVKTRTGVMLGSPKYMSPEQVEGGRVDSRSDLFSLGSVLYELLTGSAPFNGNDIGSLLFDIARGEPPAPSQRNPQIPPVLDLIVGKALRKKPADRYQDGNELARDLAQCAASLAGGATVASALLPPRSHGGRPPVDPEAMTRPAPLFPDFVHSDSADRTAIESRPPLADPEQTQVQPSRRARSSGPAPLPPPAAPSLGEATSLGGLPISPHWDSSAALRRLEQLATGAATLRARSSTGGNRWAWPLTYAVAVLAAAWIAFG